MLWRFVIVLLNASLRSGSTPHAEVVAPPLLGLNWSPISMWQTWDRSTHTSWQRAQTTSPVSSSALSSSIVEYYCTVSTLHNIYTICTQYLQETSCICQSVFENKSDQFCTQYHVFYTFLFQNFVL